MTRSLRLVAASRSEEDCRRVMDWRNNSQTLKMFYHSKPKEWSSFRKEYLKTYFKNRGLAPKFATHRRQKVAFLRFAPYHEIPQLTKAVDVDINVDPHKRGRGLGARAIHSAKRWAFIKGYKAVVAEIKIKNAASVAAFTKAGFKEWDRHDKWVADMRKKFKIIRMVCYAPKKK